MKQTLFFLFYFILFTGGPNSKADSIVDAIKGELEKCELSLRVDVLADIMDCLNRNEGIKNKIEVTERIKAVLGLIACTKNDLKKIPDCMNELSVYIPDVEQAQYKNILVCSPTTAEISSFKDLEAIGDDVTILGCRRPFSDDPTLVEQTLTKNEFIEYIFSSNRRFILIERNMIFYGVRELEIYFEYVKMLYEES